MSRTWPPKLSVLLLALLLPLPSLAQEAPPPPRRLDVEQVVMKSLLLPALGAAASDSWLLASGQLLLDVLAVAAILAPTRPDAGSGIPQAFGLAALVANRAMGAPLNAFWARRHNLAAEGSAPPLGWNLALVSGIGGYRNDGALSLGFAYEMRRFGLRASYGLATGDITVYTSEPDAEGTRVSRSREETGILGVTAYGRWRLGRTLELQPGLHATRSTQVYHETRFRPDEDLGGGEVSYSGSISLVPEATLAWKPFARVHGAVGLGYALLIPRHVLDFDTGEPDWSKRLGAHAEMRLQMF